MPLLYTNGLFSPNQLRDEMDRLLTGFLGHSPDWPGPGVFRPQPALNVWTDDEAVLIEAEIPGLKSDQLEISVSGDELSLKVQRPDLEEEGVTYHRRERPTGTFTRVVRLPTEVDAERVQAELRDGVLRITLPKVPAAKPRRIEVAVAK